MKVYLNKKNNLFSKISKTTALIVVLMLLSLKPSFSQEITAIDFNGDLIGKVIPDGKVVSFDNQLIGNINADSLIVDFKGELIGGIVPQGIAIGNDNKFLGKVNNDGTVRLPSGKVVGKTLPNGLVVDEFYDVTGFVLFPGLIYSDEGKTVGRLTGDGSYTNLQGQKIGFVSTDGYAYRKVGNDYVLDGRLISSKMIVAANGDFIGSVSPGGEVSDSEAKIIGRIKANGFAYSTEGKVIGRIVSAGYAFDNYGRYLGFVNYNGEVINKEQLMGRLTSAGDIIDLSGKIIGYTLDFAATYSDFNGRYLGRLIPNGKIVKAKEIIGEVISKDIIVSDNVAMGLKLNTGPVFDYRGMLVAHAQRNGSTVLFEGTPVGNMRGTYAYNKSGQIMGAVDFEKLAIDINNRYLGLNNISSSVGSGEDKSIVSPFGYIFSPEGKIYGHTQNIGGIYFDGLRVAELSPNGEVLNKGNIINGKMTSAGIQINDANKVFGKTLDAKYLILNSGKDVGYISNSNIIFDIDRRVVAKVLSDNTIVGASSDTSKALMPKTGQAYGGNVVLGVSGSFIGYVGVNGVVRDSSNSIIGQVAERGIVLDNNGSFLGEVVPYTVALDNECEFIGVLTPRGDIRNSKDIFIGKQLLNGQVISDSGSKIGYTVKQSTVIDNNGNVAGIISPDGKVFNYNNEKLGCLNAKGLLKNADGTVFASISSNNQVINFNGDIIGRSNLLGSLISNDGESVGYVQSDGNVNSKTGLPLGNLFKYKFAFDDNNKFLGIVKDDGSVMGAGNQNFGMVDFNGQVNPDSSGYALYDLYVYDNDNNAIGYIAKDGNVLSFAGQNIGKIDKGFVVDKAGKVIARGNRDFHIRNEIRIIIGELNLNGDMVDASGKAIGKINIDTGLIADSNGATLGQAHFLQYYGKSIAAKPVYNESGRVIGYAGDDGSVVDENGKIIALINENGLAVSANGDIIGGIGTDWFEKAPKVTKTDSKDIEVGVIDRNTQDKIKRSFAVALTPDGEYLGKILDDGTVVDDAGNVIGVKLGDGLIIDQNGGLIGIEESVKGEIGGGVFVPSGTFGPGAAYGTGSGPGGNLGPGGGYGPGERYDPQRSAALAAAQDERRKNINVGKISTSINPSSFDGYQKNWDDLGISKAISSWRVDMSEMILSDKPIPAVIARSIDSNNPTPITAVVERNVYAEEGRNIIIPAGSRVIGSLGGLTMGSESTSASAKVQITWERLIRPDGSTFVFSGVTGDAQGRGGALGYLDQQLFKKYSLPIMTSVMKSGVAYMMAPSEQSSTETETPKQEAANDARESFLQDMQGIFDQVMADKANIRPLTYVPAGTRIIIYPNVDLWVRTPERDELEANAALNKKDVFIDDKEAQSERKEQEIKKRVGSGTTSTVVYEPEDADVKAQTPTLLSPDTNAGNKKQGGTGATPPPPPPPPSTFGGTAPPAQKSTGGSISTPAPTGNVPQLF